MDQENWTRIAEVTGAEKFTEKSIPMDGKFEGLFFRVTFRAVQGAPAPAVSEFEIML